MHLTRIQGCVAVAIQRHHKARSFEFVRTVVGIIMGNGYFCCMDNFNDGSTITLCGIEKFVGQNKHNSVSTTVTDDLDDTTDKKTQFY